ncbi:fibrinogen C domain-containing protein 1 isoform X1 [Drosophila subobscura]|uniref:fibrinogen C domain-containing protein 1 isoform X1 n=1 Tax=Drosophila subobscura TaxID=7241 RepID=UPI00155AB1F3|nr:fibrinogen C domain-containing protein 1 isoform X1 [Drosophila subobscura]XP_034655287.1 fibrinogen C domain-containing protein 1 isoform X1 [Drosophila subobscura]
MMCPAQLKAMAIGIACILAAICVCEGSSLVEPPMTQAPPTLSPAHVRSRLRTNFRASPVSAPTTPPRCEYKELMTNLHDRVGILATLDEDQRHRLEVIDKKLDQLVDSNAARMESLKAQQLNFQQRLDSFEHIQRLSRSTLDELKGETDLTLGPRRVRELKQKLSNRRKMKDISRSVRSAPQQYAPLPNSSAGNIDISLTDRLDALATLLTSTALSVRTVQEDVFKLTQAINRQRRLSHRRVPPNLIGQPGAAAFPAYPRASPATSCLQYYLSVQGILKLQLTPESESFYVACDGDWTVILNRSSDEINFERGWLDYKDGFGNLAGDFFIGLNKLHALTSAAIHELRIVFEDFDGHVAYAGYSTFAIGSERELYPLSLLGRFQSELSPSAGDSLSYHAGAKFSTIDSDNDNCLDCSCAQRYKGAGWFNNCGTSNIMGQYHQQNYAKAGESGIFWDTFQGKDYSLRRVRMMIRPIGEEEARR